MTTHGQFNWNELIAADPDRAMAFYAETLGWSFEAETMPTGDTYWLILADGAPVGGIMPASASYIPYDGDRWMTFIHCDDLDGATKRAAASGAVVLRAPWRVPGVGRVCVLREPGGAVVGWMTPAAPPQAS